MNKATIEQLNGMHDAIATYFTSLLASGERLQPGELSAVLKFLKDNSITAELVESKPMQNLIQTFMDNEDLYVDAPSVYA